MAGSSTFGRVRLLRLSCGSSFVGAASAVGAGVSVLADHRPDIRLISDGRDAPSGTGSVCINSSSRPTSRGASGVNNGRRITVACACPLATSAAPASDAVVSSAALSVLGTSKPSNLWSDASADLTAFSRSSCCSVSSIPISIVGISAAAAVSAAISVSASASVSNAGICAISADASSAGAVATGISAAGAVKAFTRICGCGVTVACAAGGVAGWIAGCAGMIVGSLIKGNGLVCSIDSIPVATTDTRITPSSFSSNADPKIIVAS